MKPKACTAREVEAVALSLGFTYIRSSGSHRVYQNGKGRTTIIAFHGGDVPLGTLRGIIKQMGITTKDFNHMV